MRRQETRRGATATPARAAAKSGAKAKATPEAATAKGRTAGGRGAAQKAVARPEAETAKGRVVMTQKAAPVAKKAAPVVKKAAPVAKKPAPAVKKAAPAAKRPASALKKKKAAAPKASRTRQATPLAPEALPRVRRTVDRPAETRQRPTRAPRDRSQRQAPGLRELEWPQMALAARNLARQIARTFTPELVVGVAKGGIFAGQEVATSLRVPFFPVRIGKRSRDAGHQALEAAATMPPEAEGKRVLVVDDIAGSGATLQAATAAIEKAGASEVRTATLVVRAGGFVPDFFGVETGDLVVFPWDYEATTGAVGSGSAGDDEDLEVAGEAPGPDEDEIDTFGV